VGTLSLPAGHSIREDHGREHRGRGSGPLRTLHRGGWRARGGVAAAPDRLGEALAIPDGPVRDRGDPSRLRPQTGLYAIAAIRIVFGLALWFAAPDSRAPGLLLILGAFTVLVGVATPFFGVRRFAAILDWWSQRPSALLRTWCAVVVALGLAIVWVLLPGSGTG
jgi:hypothetical protein